jgi:pimeloyl-ACP methyl ester carboxylesterase
MEASQPSMEDYAKAFAEILVSHRRFRESNGNPVYLGGFCMGGMVSLVTVSEIKKLSPDAKIGGVILLSSCLSFRETVREELKLLAFFILQSLPSRAAIHLIAAYLGHKLGSVTGFLSKLTRGMRLKALTGSSGRSYAGDLYLEMLMDQDARSVYRRLQSETSFDFTKSILEQGQSFPPIYHLHGDNDLLLPFGRIDSYRKRILASSAVVYELERLRGANHFVPITHPDSVYGFIRRILDSNEKEN